MDVSTVQLGLPTTDTLRRLENRIGRVDAQAAPDETVKKFESVLSTLLVKEMRRSLPEGFFGGGADGDIYSGWLDEHVGQSLAERDALHLRDLITRSVMQKNEPVVDGVTQGPARPAQAGEVIP